jgi:hypothetical protein
MSAFIYYFIRSLPTHKVSIFQSMGDGKGFVGQAFFLDPVRPMVHGLVCPVVITPLQSFPGFFGFCMPGGISSHKGAMLSNMPSSIRGLYPRSSLMNVSGF